MIDRTVVSGSANLITYRHIYSHTSIRMQSERMKMVKQIGRELLWIRRGVWCRLGWFPGPAAAVAVVKLFP